MSLQEGSRHRLGTTVAGLIDRAKRPFGRDEITLEAQRPFSATVEEFYSVRGMRRFTGQISQGEEYTVMCDRYDNRGRFFPGFVTVTSTREGEDITYARGTFGAVRKTTSTGNTASLIQEDVQQLQRVAQDIKARLRQEELDNQARKKGQLLNRTIFHTFNPFSAEQRALLTGNPATDERITQLLQNESGTVFFACPVSDTMVATLEQVDVNLYTCCIISIYDHDGTVRGIYTLTHSRYDSPFEANVEKTTSVIPTISDGETSDMPIATTHFSEEDIVIMDALRAQITTYQKQRKEFRQVDEEYRDRQKLEQDRKIREIINRVRELKKWEVEIDEELGGLALEYIKVSRLTGLSLPDDFFRSEFYDIVKSYSDSDPKTD